MKIQIFVVDSTVPSWVRELREVYLEKISHFHPMDLTIIPAYTAKRTDSAAKVLRETDKILEKLSPTDWLVLCDEKGVSWDTQKLAKNLIQKIEAPSGRLVFVVGGAFGVGEKLIQRANMKLSLSSLTLSHLVAQTVLLEQLYRVLTIWKGRKYHNE